MTSRIRIGDEDRERVAEALRVAAGEGRLDHDELDERLEAAYGAKFHDDLAPLLVDLPGRFAQGALPAPPEAPTHRGAGVAVPGVRGGAAPAPWFGHYLFHTSANFSSVVRRGRWGMAHRHRVRAVGGSVSLDLREAQFPRQFVRVEIVAGFSEIELIVHPTTAVVIEGPRRVRQVDDVPAQIDSSSPVVRVRAMTVGGSIVVHRREAPR